MVDKIAHFFADGGRKIIADTLGDKLKIQTVPHVELSAIRITTLPESLARHIQSRVDGLNQLFRGGTSLVGQFVLAQKIVKVGHVPQHGNISSVETCGGVDVSGDTFEEMPRIIAEVG